MLKKQNNILILPDIRSALNVGAIFRTADAVGIYKIYLVGVTPRPTDQFGRIQKDIAKSALGAEKTVFWEYKKSLAQLISKLKKEGFKIIAIEQDEKAIDYKTLRRGSGRGVKIGEKNVFIVGTEVTGLTENILQKCDIVAEIPMKGEKESLNVSVATGIALFRILNV